MVQIIPEGLEKLWNAWEVRAMVLSSLFLQIVLIILGNRRKYSTKTWVRIITWMAYLSADSVATVALGMISNFQGDDDDKCKKNPPHPNNHIMAFWAPFLLLHLGGPDTITAYSLEDNELWLRHLLTLIVQVVVAFYIFLTSFTSSTYRLSLLAIPMFVAGIIKYGERTWALLCGSSERFGEGPVLNLVTVHHHNPEYLVIDSEQKCIEQGYNLHQVIIKFLYGNVKPDDHHGSSFGNYLDGLWADRSPSSEYFFKHIEIALGYMYDLLYTKASVAYCFKGIIFRSLSLVCSVSTFVVFCLVIDKQLYSTIDVTVTYILSGGAIVLELYAIIVLLSTDWTLHWLNTTTVDRPLARFITSIRSKLIIYDQRWSGSMGQINMIDFCLKEKSSKCAGIIRKLRYKWAIIRKLQMYWYTGSDAVPSTMKQLIFEQVKQVAHSVKQAHYVRDDDRSQVMSWRGNHALEKYCKDGNIDKFRFFVVGPFENSIVCWHLATDICYYRDIGTCQDDKLKVSKLISDYMMYILVMRPSMLPNGSGHFIFRDKSGVVSNFLEEKKNNILDRKSARQVLYDAGTENDSGGVLFVGDGYVEENLEMRNPVYILSNMLAKLLVEHDHEDESSVSKWEMISEVWIEMLCYAACKCGWNQHAQQLNRGGEFLTHVCTLMATFGFTPLHERSMWS